MLAPHQTRTPEHREELTSVVLIILIIAHWSLPLQVIVFLVTTQVTLISRQFSIDHWFGVPVHNCRSVAARLLAGDKNTITSLAFPWPSSLSCLPLAFFPFLPSFEGLWTRREMKKPCSIAVYSESIYVLDGATIVYEITWRFALQAC